jgi:hypothetical protein
MAIRVYKESGSIQSAVSEARTKPKHKRKIIIDAGDYFLDSPLILTPEDSGLTIEAEGEVRILGGKKVDRWKSHQGKFWVAPISEIGEGKLDFRMLMVNGRFAKRARFPETGFLKHETEFDVKWLSTFEGGFERIPTYDELTTLRFKSSDIPDSFVPENAEFTIFHMWDESLVGIRSFDRENNVIRFSNPAGWPPGAFSKAYNFERRYIIWNTIEGMLKPGQWFLDRKNKQIVYWPLPGETIGNIEVTVPLSEKVIILNGTDSNPIKDITLRNFSVMVTNAPLMSGAFGAKLFDGAISIHHGENCTLTNLEIANVSAHCIKASGINLRIEDCRLHHSGAGAIRLIGSNALIRNNHIHHVGLTFPSAIALYVGATDPNLAEEWVPGQLYTDCTIEHNEIHDVPYAAVCAGGKNLTILKNLIYRAMQDLYDGAGIYITFCNNALVKNNLIKDIKDTPGAGTSAFYLDEKTLDAKIEENVAINVPRSSHNHISENNIFRNNFFIINGKGKFTIERSANYTFENNVVVANDGFEIYDLAFCTTFRNNIIYTNGRLTTKDLDKYTVLRQYEVELKNGNINKNPLLINYADGRIELSPDSPAHEMGIKSIDISDAGLIKK